MAVEVPENEEVFGGGRNKEEKGIGSAIRQKRTNRRSVNINERDKVELFSEMLNP